MSLEHGYPYAYPYHHGGYPGYGGYPGMHHPYQGYGAGYGHPGYHGGLYGAHHGAYAPHMLPYDPRAYQPFEERRKTKAPEPGHRFSSPQHSQKTGKK